MKPKSVEGAFYSLDGVVRWNATRFVFEGRSLAAPYAWGALACVVGDAVLVFVDFGRAGASFRLVAIGMVYFFGALLSLLTTAVAGEARRRGRIFALEAGATGAGGYREAPERVLTIDGARVPAADVSGVSVRSRFIATHRRSITRHVLTLDLVGGARPLAVFDDASIARQAQEALAERLGVAVSTEVREAAPPSSFGTGLLQIVYLIALIVGMFAIVMPESLFPVSRDEAGAWWLVLGVWSVMLSGAGLLHLVGGGRAAGDG